MTEDRDDDPDAVARKRLRLRSWRRGMREMDLLLGPFADRELAAMAGHEIAEYAALLDVDDPQLYGWIMAETGGRRTAPPRFEALVARIADAAGARGRTSRHNSPEAGPP